jgi:hypothetical protein
MCVQRGFHVCNVGNGVVGLSDLKLHLLTSIDKCSILNYRSEDVFDVFDSDPVLRSWGLCIKLDNILRHGQHLDFRFFFRLGFTLNSAYILTIPWVLGSIWTLEKPHCGES